MYSTQLRTNYGISLISHSVETILNINASGIADVGY